ncbi:hypothetical protein LTS18_001826 [Coniosporium uncinatum]|uniref:Uncharacterized protein n=1 Tax=Coniosporium uncinatum TaxID=93489 RepID=A0ACC3DYZ3_9PEZI|nr:hypothetical protein LTS18_001826 [Coniosporium uncinatum]
MTVEERVNVTRGFPGSCVGNSGAVPRLGIPPLCFADAPDGIRGSDFVSAFPAGIHLGATWDAKLMYDYGKALGREYRDKGINVALGPVAGPLGRVARGGRNWEGLTNDPYLSGIGVGEITRGLQDSGTISTVKHWLFNEEEYRRNPGPEGEAISSNVDDKTLHELYAFPFMDSLKAGAACVMCSYQRINNSYGCQNSKTLNGVLKTEFGFEGFVVSDWAAQHAGVATANAGLDVVMPNGGFWGNNLTEAVNNGSVSTERLNDMVTRTLAAWYLLGQDDGYPEVGVFPYNVQHPVVNVQDHHAQVIREIGAAGHVLLKNVNGTLPLKKPSFLSIYGYDADVKANPWVNPSRYGGGYEVNFNWTTFNGTLITGGGSGGSSPPYVVSPFMAIQNRIIADRGTVRWDFISQNPTIYANAEACLVFINAYASESFDRWSLTDEWSDTLVNNVAANCSNTIVIVHATGIRVMDAWIEHPNVTAVLWAGLPGQESGNSLVDVLYGDVTPSGKLPFTIAKREEHYGSLLNSTVAPPDTAFPQSDFTEGVFIDYRAFDKDGIQPRFEFGFGLSYSNFSYSNLQVARVGGASMSPYPDPAIAIVQGGHPQLWDVLFNVTCTVENTGRVAAAEVAQLYVGELYDGAPVKQLRGFGKKMLAVNESAVFAFPLTRRDLSQWDVVAQQWRMDESAVDVFVGASSRDLRLNGTVQV